MASTLSLYIVLALSISVQNSLGTYVTSISLLDGGSIECGNLNKGSCSFAVSSKGKRCVLETRMFGRGYTCRTSEIKVAEFKDYIETEECVSACGVDRKTLGISSDSLLDKSFTRSLCSDNCYQNCPNIVDLYFNLAAGEGVYLPAFCEARISNSGRREMVELNSAGEEVAANDKVAVAPQAAKNKVVDASAPGPVQ